MEQKQFPFPKTMPVMPSTNRMNKTANAGDIYRAELIAKARLLKIGTVHIFDTDNPKGGLTVAFRKMSQYKSGKMVECAVATCSDEDAFSKKIGTTRALENFFDGNTIELPLLAYYDLRDLNGVVKRAFTALYLAN
jgi:hypothetical protein